MTRCQHCPCEPDVSCLGRSGDPRFADFCALAASGDPVKVRRVRDRSRIGIEPAAGAGQGPSVPQHTVIPLAGDLIALATKLIGADRLALWLAEQAGREDCGCPARQARLNELDAKLRKYLKRSK